MSLLLVQGTAQWLPVADASIHTCVTSPPYFGLRQYESLKPDLWPAGDYAPLPGAAPIAVPAETACLGSETTIAAYIWHLLVCFREVWRTLRQDGTFWVNLGDSFSSGNRHGHGTRVGYKQSTNRGMNGTCDPTRPPQPDGYPQGTLLGIPQQVMLAAVADGWICRNDLVWQKISPMPESVRGWRFESPACACVVYRNDTRRTTPGLHDREGFYSHTGRNVGQDNNPAGLADPDCPTCHGTGRAGAPVLRRGSWRHTRSHEYIFQLVKNMGYFADGETVREPHTSGDDPRNHPGYVSKRERNRGGRTDGYTAATGAMSWPAGGRNPRSVLTPQPSALNLAHYAAFPPSLIEPLIRATCPAQCCAVCGQGYAPTIRETGARDASANGSRFDVGKTAHHGHVQAGERTVKASDGTLQPSCACGTDLPPVSGICLDPFSGSGTVGLVSRALRRRAILIEASPAYIQLSRQRLGLQDLAAWEHGAPAAPVTYTDLPLFAQED